MEYNIFSITRAQMQPLSRLSRRSIPKRLHNMDGDDIYELIEREVSGFGDEKITAYFSQTQSMRDGMGADGHPSKRTHQNSADILAEKIRNTLGE